MFTSELSREEAIAIIKVHLEDFEYYDTNGLEKAAEYLYSCLFSAELDKSLGKLDLSKYVGEEIS